MKNPLIIFASFILLLGACKDNDDATPDKPVSPDEQELITTVKLNFKDPFQQSNTYVFSDPDGPGGNAPSVDTIKIKRSTIYEVEASFFDESDPNDIEDITIEIKAKDKEHLLCFETDGLSGLSIQKTDTDGTYPLGLTSTWTVSDSASSNNGRLKLILKHQVGVKDGTCSPGETDVEVNFPLVFE